MTQRFVPPAVGPADARARMRRGLTLACSLLSAALTVGLILAGLVFLALGTEAGQALMRTQTEGLVARVLGSEYAATLGHQTIGLSEDGGLALQWSNAALTRTGAARPIATVETIKVGFALLPLAAGRLEVETLEIDGADVDLTGARPSPAPAAESASASSSVPSLPERSALVFAAIEQQLATLRRVGIERLVMSDVGIIAPIGQDGGPFVARIERADLRLADASAMTATATIGLDGATIPLRARANYDAGAGRLVSMTLVADPVPFGRLLPPGSPEDKLDTRPFATDAPGRISLTVATRADGLRVAEASLGLGGGALQAGRGHTTVESALLSLRYVEGGEAVELAKGDIAFDGVAMQLEGRAVALYDRPGTNAFNGFGFALQTRRMQSTIGRQVPSPLEASLLVEGRTNEAAKAAELTNVSLRTGGGSLSGTGVLRYGAPDAMTVLRLEAKDLPAANLKAFWPFNIAVNTRRWVLQHVRDGGRVVGGTIRLDVRHDRMDAAFRPGNHPNPDELDLAASLAGAAAGTAGDLPDITEADGQVWTRGGDTLVTIASAKVAGFEKVAVGPSSVSFVRAAKGLAHEIDGTLALALSGPAPDLLAIAARQPVGALRNLDLSPQDATGSAKVDASLAFILGDTVPKEKQFGVWSVGIDLAGAGLNVPVEGRSLSDMSGLLTVVPGNASGELKGRIDRIPAAIRFSRPFGPNPVGEKKAEIDVSFGDEEASSIAPALADIVDGPIAAKFVQSGDQPVKAAVDLTDTALTLPWIGWRKGRGVAAALTFDVVPGETGTALRQVALTGDGFSATGEIEADKAGLKSADLGKVALNPGDDIDVKVERVSNGFSVRVGGKRFDARPFLADLKANLGAKAENPGPRSKQQIDVGVTIDALTGFGGREIDAFSLNYAGSGGQVAALSISGTSRQGLFSADMSPRGEERAIVLRAPDAGMLAEFTGLYGRMEGGTVALDLQGSAGKGYRGTLKAENFTLVDEPRLSSLVGSSPSPNARSLSQAVGQELRTERAFFDHASVRIGYGKGGLRVAEGIIRGPVFGSSFSGTVYDSRNRIDIVGSFMPAYGVNRIFGALPVVGQILGNGNEGGLIGITYRLDGDFSSPTLTVNPISAMAPGIFRSIFAYQ